jgi:hypothetical protein
MKLNNDQIGEGFDKAMFIKWLIDESFIQSVEDDDINKIVHKWLKARHAFLTGPKPTR